MAGRTRNSKYYALKGVVNVRREEADPLQAFFYALFDPGNLHRFSLRLMSSPSMNIKRPWDEYGIMLEEAEEDRENAETEGTIRTVVHQVVEGIKFAEISGDNPIALQKLETHLNRSVGSALSGTVNAFVKVESCSTDAFHSFVAKFNPPAEDSSPPSSPAESPEEGVGEGAGGSLLDREIVLVCQPLVDPLRGKAATAVLPGDVILVKIPEDSIFFSMLTKIKKGFFDGVVEAVVTRVDRHSAETVVMETALAENVKGKVPAPNALRVKLSPSTLQEGGKPPSAPLVWALVGGGALMLGVLLWYLMT